MNITETFIIYTESSLDILGYLYLTSFDEDSPTTNLITNSTEGGDMTQFRINHSFNTDQQYVLLITTNATDCTGSFKIVISGPALVNLTRISSQF